MTKAFHLLTVGAVANENSTNLHDVSCFYNPT